MKIDVKEYSQIEKNVFAPVYPLIADQIIGATGKTAGTCIDLGCGTGALGQALLEKTDLFVYFFDESAEMLDLVGKKMAESGIEGRFNTLCGDVTSIGLDTDSVDLIVSRGSIFFWEDLEKAFQEIERILAPGGWAYIGGGFGSRQLGKEIIAKMQAKEQEGKEDFSLKVKRNLSPESQDLFAVALKHSGIKSYTFLRNEDVGLWIIIRK